MMPPMRIPKRLSLTSTSARDWMCLLYELGQRVVDDIRRENPHGWTYR